jgi:protein O-mannosyl-transferase
MVRPRFMGLLLALVTLLVYLPVGRDGFLVYDDDVYVTGNTMVQKGLTWAGVRWAFTTSHASNWHPVTWLSHMTDCELFGLNAGAHHLVNALIHTANAVLLFALLLRLTGGLWPSLFVAALFAWHPLRVESVAWVSERKDVLSTFFALLTLLAYVAYVSHKTASATRMYLLCLFLFALGLMSKPMVVSLPFVMLLLDYWPLQRWSRVESRGSSKDAGPALDSRHSTLGSLVLEKWPFFLLAAASCVVTFLVQYHGQAVMTLQRFPLHSRMANALIAYERYLGKTFWPSDLAILYPLPNHLSWIPALGLVGGVSCLIWRTRRSHPYLLVGWLWFLGTLVPVIGLVQVGVAAMADRYTYFPLVGVFIMLTFGIRDLAGRWQIPKPAITVCAGLVLGSCLLLTASQLRYWRDSETLFVHVLAVTENNHVAHFDLGLALEQKGELTAALAEYRAAEKLAPDMFQIHNNLGHLLNTLGRHEEALAEYRQALLLDPTQPPLHIGSGIVLAELGRFDEALREFQEAARLDPAYSSAPFEIGKLRLKQGRDTEAIDEFRAALRIEPNNFRILAYTARVLAASENPQIRDGQTAFVLAVKAKTLTGDSDPDVLDALGMACAELGHFDEAQTVVQKAIEIAAAAKRKNLELLQQRLQLYQSHQPWRESFRVTNTVPETVPPNGPR